MDHNQKLSKDALMSLQVNARGRSEGAQAHVPRCSQPGGRRVIKIHASAMPFKLRLRLARNGAGMLVRYQ
jgi:hypothetical protein